MSPCELCKSVLPLGNQAADPIVDSVRDRLLIAEDDPFLAEDLTGRLTSLNYEVLGIAPSGTEAVYAAKGTRPDLVLMDINLNGEMDGIQAAVQVREIQIPVVYVTGCISSSVLNRAMLSDPSGYVLKPYETSDLDTAVQLGLRRHRVERERQQLAKRFHAVLRSIKTLTGRLSICSYCKKIKDRAGNWPEIEAYVMQHSHASFTHGMCPDCFARMKKQLETIESGATPDQTLVLG